MTSSIIGNRISSPSLEKEMQRHEYSNLQTYIGLVLEGHEWLDNIALEVIRNVPVQVMDSIFVFSSRNESTSRGETRTENKNLKLARTEAWNSDLAQVINPPEDAAFAPIEEYNTHQPRTGAKTLRIDSEMVNDPVENTRSDSVYVITPFLSPSYAPVHEPFYVSGPSNIANR